MQLLNWNKNLNAQNIGGCYYDSDTKTLPVFINYHKAEDAIEFDYPNFHLSMDCFWCEIVQGDWS